ncbi:hypothetical protein TNCV_4003231 [Trichonephila clavipes]|nr:hypothetical protein TNCV_4003231 [Trichonephila clavipes]
MIRLTTSMSTIESLIIHNTLTLKSIDLSPWAAIVRKPFLRGSSFNLQPQRSLRVATEYQSWLLEAVVLRFPAFLTTSKEMPGRTTKLEGR